MSYLTVKVSRRLKNQHQILITESAKSRKRNVPPIPDALDKHAKHAMSTKAGVAKARWRTRVVDVL